MSYSRSTDTRLGEDDPQLVESESVGNLATHPTVVPTRELALSMARSNFNSFKDLIRAMAVDYFIIGSHYHSLSSHIRWDPRAEATGFDKLAHGHFTVSNRRDIPKMIKLLSEGQIVLQQIYTSLEVDIEFIDLENIVSNLSILSGLMPDAFNTMKRLRVIIKLWTHVILPEHRTLPKGVTKSRTYRFEQQQQNDWLAALPIICFGNIKSDDAARSRDAASNENSEIGEDSAASGHFASENAERSDADECTASEDDGEDSEAVSSDSEESCSDGEGCEYTAGGSDKQNGSEAGISASNAVTA